MSRRAHQERPGRESGFTLIELLVSLTVLSLILAALSGAIRVLSKNWEANAQRIETLDMVARASDILRRDAAGLQRIAVQKDRVAQYVFSGSDTSLSFVTLEPSYPSAAGPYFVRYSVVPNGPEANLVRARVRYQKGMAAFTKASEANSVRLVEGRYRYHFAYADKTAGSGKWLNSWTAVNRLPELIRLQIFDVKRDMPLAPPLVAAVRADAEIGCLAKKAGLCSAKSGGNLTAVNKQAEQAEDGSGDGNGRKGNSGEGDL